MGRDVVAAMLARVEQTLEQAAGCFPVTGDPGTGSWQWSPDGGWSGGFWAGSLWLAATAGADSRLAQAAREAAQRLRPRATAATLMRGFLFWYGAGIGVHLGHADVATEALAVRAAQQLATDVDPTVRLLPPGVEDVEGYEWPRPGACIDGVPGVVPLLAFVAERTGDSRLRALAISHAHGHRRLCLRADGSLAQNATYDPAGRLIERHAVNGAAPNSTWARAQAWGILGLAQAARQAPDLVTPARSATDWWLAHVPDGRISYWDFDDPAIPDAPLDTSATAIAAAGMLSLASVLQEGDSGRYRRAAAATLTTLARHVDHRGALLDGCYNARKGLATRNELIWGDYFLLAAMLAFRGVIDPALL